MISLLVSDIGRSRYVEAWSLQQRLWTARHSSAIDDTLLCTEHTHVYTFGKGSNSHHLLASEAELLTSGTDVVHVDRGGDITYHGPGQIVCYPILDLNNYFLDVHRYLRSLEDVIIRALVNFGISANRETGLTGVWVRGEKIAAIGIKISRWVTMHGFALNVNTDLSRFDRIIPCGIFHKGVTSMQQILGKEVLIGDVQKVLAESFAEVFGCKSHWIAKRELLAAIAEYENRTENVKTTEQNSVAQLDVSESNII